MVQRPGASGALDGIATFAQEEFEYTYDGPQHPLAEQIANGQAALDLIGQTAGSVPQQPTVDSELAKAEERGDYKTTLAIKGQQVELWFRG